MTIYAPTWCPGDPCDPCVAPCHGTFVQGTYTDSSHAESLFSWAGHLYCDNPCAFFQPGVPATVELSSGYSNYFTSDPQQSAYAAMLNSLTGNWSITLNYDGILVYVITTAMDYVNTGNQGYGGIWNLVLSNNYSPDPVNITFISGGVEGTEAGWPYPGPVDPDNPPHTFDWKVAGTYQYIGGSSFAPAIVTAHQSFSIKPGVYIFQ